jgi:tetratricopeptide (TPR) repeat protein
MSHAANQLINQANRARKEHRLADAYRDLTEAVALCRQAGTRCELIQALKALGQIERDLGRSEAARPLYEEAIALCREEGDPIALAHTVRHLGDIHRDAGHLTQAEPCYHEALALYRGHEHAPLDLANAIRPLAIRKEAVGEAEAARRLWEEARDLYEAAKVQVAVAECSARLARLSSGP